LDWRNGFDIFGKRVVEPVLQQVGQDGYNAYHSMQDWGMDILKVGTSLGAGGYGFWDGEQVKIVQNTSGRSASIINNGPLYSSFKIHYKDWKINGQTLDLDAQLSMTAGSRLVETRLSLSEDLPNLVIGFVKHENTELILGDRAIPDDAFTYLASWGPQSLAGDQLGMAVFFQRGDFTKMVEDQNSYAALMHTDEKALSYFFAAAWEGEHDKGIASKEAFLAWLEQEAERLSHSPDVQFGNILSGETIQQEMTTAIAP
jgi:unsaturated rhamnogalacturonyl hydrolase